MAQINELLAPDVRALITRQHGIIAATQAAARGMPHETLRIRVARGLWQRLLPGVYLLQCGPPNPVQCAVAAQVYAGEGSIVTGPAALRLHGIGDTAADLWDDDDGALSSTAGPMNPDPRTPPIRSAATDPNPDPGPDADPDPATPTPPNRPPTRATPTVAAALSPHASAATGAAAAAAAAARFPSRRVHLLVPHGQRRQNIEYVRISRTTRLPDPVRRHGVNLAPPARAVLDACSWCLEAADEVVAEVFVESVVRAAVSAGLASLSDLEHELEQAPRRHTRALRQALARARGRERVIATRRLFDGLGRLGPLGAMRDVAIYGERRRIVVAEALWPTRALVVTVDAKPNQVAELSRLGFAVIQVSAHALAEDAAEVVSGIAAALAARPEATLPRGVALLPLGRSESDLTAVEEVHSRVQFALATTPTLPPWPGLRVRRPTFSGAF